MSGTPFSNVNNIQSKQLYDAIFTVSFMYLQDENTIKDETLINN